MSRRWVQSATVEINDQTGAVLVEGTVEGGVSPTSLAGGTKTVAATGTPEKVVAVATPCKFVWLGARVDANGTAVNTKPAFVGDNAGQNIPLLADNFEGMVIQIDDASKLYVKVGVNGEGVAYRIFA